MAYVKDGILILGDRPMFDDVEENIGQAVKAKFLEVFGFYPLLDVSERWEIMSDEELYMAEPVVLRDYHVILDTERLDLIDDWNLNYVVDLFAKVITARLKDDSAKSLNCYSSKKYCFSDTEDWWDKMRVDSEDLLPSNREAFEMSVELG